MNYFPRCCDLFSGAGGFSLGASRVGFEIAAAVELDCWASETYRKNIISKNGNLTRLYNQDINSIVLDAFIEENNFANDGCDLIIGGPPCQGFSSHRRRLEGVNDPRNQLLIKYFEFVRQIRPKFFLVENVPGLIWSRNKDYLQAFYSIATESGYKVLNPEILNAMNFGIPQSRKRVFILGIRGDLNIDTLFWPPKPTYGNGLKELVPSSIAFTETWDGDPNDIHSVHTEEIISAFKNTPINGGSRMESGRQLKCHIGHKGHSDVYGRIDPSKPAPTMTAGCTSPSKGRFVHPTEPHGITLRQAARLQTFPDDFIFYGGMTSSTRQIGNAVPVLMAESVLRPIYDILVSIDLEKLKMEDAA